MALVARPSLWTVAELLGGGFLFRDFKVPREPPPRQPRQTCITRLENTRLDKAWLPAWLLGFGLSLRRPLYRISTAYTGDPGQ